MSRSLRCSLLCEDLEQERFFRPILEKMFGEGKIYVERKAVEEAGGVTFVFKSLKRCVSYVRRYPNEAVGLVVVLDGDDDGLDQRILQLDSMLDENRKPYERIAYCVPSRTIETWEYWLYGARDLNELVDCKRAIQQLRDKGEISARKMLQAWFSQTSETQKQLESERVPSLKAGRKELNDLNRKANL